MAEKAKSAKKIAKAEEKAKAAAVPAQEKNLAVRGNVFEGKVISAKANKTVTVERELVHYIAKYERYLKVKSKIKAHNPENINAKEGDIVKVGETRRISKTKNFLVLEIVKKA